MPTPQPQPQVPGSPQPKSSKKTCLIVLVVLFVLFVCAVMGFFVLLAPAFMKAKQKADMVHCANNLKQIGLAAMQYADDKRYFPYDPSDPTGQKAFDFLVEHYGLDKAALTCPNEKSELSYEGFAFQVNFNSAPGLPLAWDKKPHPDGHRVVVFLDAHTQWLDEADFQQLLQQAREKAKSR